MGNEGGQWRDGRRAWKRLEGWLRDDDGGDDPAALTALCDIGRLRRVLDQAELVAVRTARRRGKSWAEIATQLGVTRQSAWERWKDLDEAPGEPDAVIGQAALELRRRATVIVPNIVGVTVYEARETLEQRGLFGVGSDPDAPPMTGDDATRFVVTDQSPEAGAKVPRGSTVRLWVERGGGSGVREPRRPQPDPWVGRAMRDELTDEAVG